MNNINIEIPEGKVIDLEKSVITPNVCNLVFKSQKLPSTWEEAMKPYEGCSKFVYIDDIGNIITAYDMEINSQYYTTISSEELAERVIEFLKLLFIRDIYRAGWKPTPTEQGYGITRVRDEGLKIYVLQSFETFSFPTETLAKTFKENFHNALLFIEDLI